jgi:hypothetical protein
MFLSPAIESELEALVPTGSTLENEMIPATRRGFLPVLACFALAAPAGATTYVMMSDAALADQAALIVEGRIAGLGEAAGAPGRAIEYTVELVRVLKGGIADATLAVRVPGGMPRQDGPWVKAWGVPRFRPGESVLLFLAPRRDGSFDVTQLALGAFQAVSHEGRRLALRPEILAHGVAGGEERLRDFAGFADWLGARARGEERPEDYFVAPPAGGLAALAERFVLFEDQGRNFRWFEFDYGLKVRYHANQTGQPGMAGGGFGEVSTALWAWNLDPRSSVELRFGGSTAVDTPWFQCDDYNLFLFDDPHDEIGGSFDCARGGALAIGFVCVKGTGKYEGKEHWSIGEGDVLTQDGAGCVFAHSDGKVGAFIFAHEVGHTLGFRHPCGDFDSTDANCSEPSHAAAIMVPAVPARAAEGAKLGNDDRAALAALYPEAEDGGDGGGEPDGWLSDSAVPGFRFKVEITAGGGPPLLGQKEDACLAETICASGAVAGRVEVLMRVIGPKPNGKLWPTFIKFTTSRVDIQVEQIATGVTKTYTLEGAGPDSDELPGLFDRGGFDP